MEYSPPPLFKQGAPARVKVTVFAFISIVLLMVDSRLHALDKVRVVQGAVLYPFQQAALVPRNALASMGTYFSSLSMLEKQVRELKMAEVASAQTMQQAQHQLAENVQLRKLMGARESLPVESLMGEILYDARDPSSRKVVLDRGANDKVILGLPVIDNAGVVGQVTRVFPFTSEVTLLTDREQAIPVQVLRNGLRSVAYGRGQSGQLELRFVTPNADIVVGDVLITSGMDGVYPAGLAVAKVVKVENSAGGAFGGVVCQPLAGIDRHRHLLILMSLNALPPRPADEPLKPPKKSALPKMTPISATGAPALAPAAPARPASQPGQPGQSAAPATRPANPGTPPATPNTARPATAATGAAR
jgi:rod shape-determining protein MreC